jgi:hypothetical protein
VRLGTLTAEQLPGADPRGLEAPAAAEHARVRLPFLDCGPEIVLALASGSAAFQDITLAFFLGREPVGPAQTWAISSEDRNTLRDNFAVLVDNFEAEHGSIVRSYFREPLHGGRRADEH